MDVASESDALINDNNSSSINGENIVNAEELNNETIIIKPNRLIVVEPVLIILTLCYSPLVLIQSLFIYQYFENEAAVKLDVTPKASAHILYCDVNTSSVDYKIVQMAQSDSSLFNIFLSLAGTIPCLISTVFLGPYSDKAGRRYTILCPLFGGFINAMVCFIVVQFKLSVWYLLIGAFIDGVGGKFTLLLLGCFSYIADTTLAENRQFRIVLIELVFFMSAMLGPLGVGNLINKLGYNWPLLIVASGYFLNITYSLFFIPETIVKDPNAKFWSTTQLKSIINLFLKDTETNRRWQLRWLFLAFIPVLICVLGDNITTLFLQNVPLCWNSVKIGNYEAIFIGVCAVGGIISARLMKICMADYAIALVSVISSIVRKIYHGFVKTDLMVYFIPAFSIFAMLFVPTVRAMMSKLVGPREQGAVFGAIAIVEVVFSFAGSFLFSAIYAETSGFMPGFVYFVQAFIYLLALLLFMVYLIRLKKHNRKHELLLSESEDDKTS